MKMLPHCHPVEAQLLAFTTAYAIPNMLEEFQKKMAILQGLLLFATKENPFDLSQIVIF